MTFQRVNQSLENAPIRHTDQSETLAVKVDYIHFLQVHVIDLPSKLHGQQTKVSSLTLSTIRSSPLMANVAFSFRQSAKRQEEK